MDAGAGALARRPGRRFGPRCGNLGPGGAGRVQAAVGPGKAGRLRKLS